MPRHSGFLFSIIGQIKDKPVRIGTEVGVWLGTNAKELFNQFPELRLNLVDCYEEDQLELALRHNRSAAAAENTAHSILQSYEDRCFWFKLLSVEAAKKIPDKSQDFVFIDADHRYESVKEDIEAWQPKVREGGILCGHDYVSNRKGCIQAVDEAFGDRINVTRGLVPVWWLFL